MAEIKVNLTKNNNTQYEITKFNGLKSIESLSESTPNPAIINYGIFSNSGELLIVDSNSEIKSLIQNGQIDNDGNKVSIYVNGNKIQEHITTNSDYSNVDKTLRLSLTNSVSGLEKKTFLGKNLSAEKTAYEMLLYIMNELGYSQVNVDAMMSAALKLYLQKIYIKYPYIDSASFKETLDKFCELARVNMYEDANGSLKIVNASPSKESTDIANAIHIPPKNMQTNLKKSIFLKNKYDKVLANYTSLEESNQGIIYTSDEIYAFDEETFIGDNPGVNNPIYTIENHIYFEEPYQTIEFSVDLDKYQFPFKPSSDNLGIKVTQNLLNITTYYDSQLNSSKSKSNGNRELLLYKNHWDKYNSFDDYIESTVLDFMEDYNSSTNYTTNNFVKYENKPYRSIYNGTFSGVAPTNTSYWEEVEPNKAYFKFHIFIEQGTSGAYEVNKVYGGFYGQNLVFNVVALNMLNGSTKRYEYGSGTHEIETKANEFIQSETLYKDAQSIEYNNKPIYELNSMFLLNDYVDGIANAEVTISCSNMFNSNNEIVKDWSLGQIIDVDDIVYFDNDLYSDNSQIYWKVTGRRFRYSGCPYLDLELQEVKIV